MQNSLKSIPIQKAISFFIDTAFILYGDELENLTEIQLKAIGLEFLLSAFHIRHETVIMVICLCLCQQV